MTNPRKTPKPPTDDQLIALADQVQAVAEPARLYILWVLGHAKKPMTLQDLNEHIALSQPTVSHHVTRLHRAGLVKKGPKNGTWAAISADPVGVNILLDNLRQMIAP